MVNSLVLFHSVVGYTTIYQPIKYVTNKEEVKTQIVFGHDIYSPISLLDYVLLFTFATLLVLLLLRIGNRRLQLSYLSLIGVVTVVLLFMGSSDYTTTLMFMSAWFIFGSVFPDIDSEKSTLGRYIKPISELIPHRTITHTIWVVLLLGVAAWYFSSIYVLMFTLGYTIHIIQDSFSRQGIAWLYPFTRYSSFSGGATVKKGRRNPIFSYRTGESVEMGILYLSILIHLGLMGYMVYIFT